MRRGTGPQSRAAPERRCHQADWRCARAWPLRAGQLMRGPSADKLIESDANAMIRHQHTLVANLAEARKADFLAGSSMQTRALVRSNAGNPYALASAHNRSPSTDLSNNDFTTFIHRLTDYLYMLFSAPALASNIIVGWTGGSYPQTYVSPIG